MNIFHAHKAKTALRKGIISFGLILVLFFSPLVPSVELAYAATTTPENTLENNTFIPPTDEGDDGANSFVPPTDNGDDGSIDFVPPTDGGDDGSNDFVPPTDTGDDGSNDFIPPVDTGDDGAIDSDTRAPEVFSVLIPTRDIGRTRINFETIQFVIAYDEQMSATSTPLISFDPGAASTSIAVTGGYWNETATEYTVVGHVVDTGLTLKDIDVIITGARDFYGNVQVSKTFFNLLNFDLFVPPTDGGDDGSNDFVPPTDTGDDGSNDFIPPVDTGDDGSNDFVPPTDNGDDGVGTGTTTPSVDIDDDFVPPTDGGDDGSNDFVPPTDDGDDGSNDFVPPVDTGDDGSNDFVPPTDSGDSGSATTTDTRSPEVTLLEVNKNKIADSNTGETFLITVYFDEEMDTTVFPQMSFIPTDSVLDTTLRYATSTWSTDATAYSAFYVIQDKNIDVRDIDVRVANAQDVAGNVMVEKLGLDMFSVDTKNPSVIVGFEPEKTTYAGGDTVVISAVFSEAVENPIIAIHTADGPFSVATTTPTATNDARAWSFEWTVPESVLANGDAIVNFFATDLFGNMSLRNDVVLTIFNETSTPDTTAPTVTNVTISDDVISEADAGTFVAVTVTFDESMNTTVMPQYGFAEDLESTTLIATGTPAWAQNGTVFSQLYVVEDTDVAELINVGFVIGGAEDLSGNTQVGYFADALVRLVDTVTPTGTITVTPGHTLVGDTQAVFSFVASEQLETAPVIYIFDTDVIAVPMTQSETEDLHWTFFWTVPDQDAAYTVIVSGADDISQNTFEERTVIQSVLSVDVTAPDAPLITEIGVSNGLINEADTGTTFLVHAKFDESLNASIIPQFNFIADDSAGVVNTLVFTEGGWDPDFTTYAAVYTIADVNVTTFDVDVRVTAAGSRDVSGTQYAFSTSKTEENLFDVDTVAPTAQFSYTPAQNSLTVGDTVEVVVTFSEDVLVSPVPKVMWTGVDTGSKNLTLVDQNDRSVWKFSYTVPTQTESGEVVFTTDAEDGAFNIVGSYSRNTRTVNSEAVRITNVAVNDGQINEADAGSVLEVTVSFNTAMDESINPTIVFTPAQVLNGTFTFDSGSWVNSTTYVATYAVADVNVDTTASARISAAKSVSGETVEEYFKTDLVRVDTIAPDATLSFSPDAVLEAGDVLTVTATFEEVFASAPRMSIATPVGTVVGSQAMTRVSDTTWSFVWNVPDGAQHNGDTKTVFTVLATDDLGNTSNATHNNTRSILNTNRDSQPPRITSVSISDTELNEGDAGQEFTVRVTFDETMKRDVEPTITFGRDLAGTLARTGSGVWENVNNTADASFTATYIIADTDIEITEANNRRPISVTVNGGADLLGNPSENTVVKENAFGIDMRAPGVVLGYELVSGDGANWPVVHPGNQVRITATFDELLEGAPILNMSTNPTVAVLSNITLIPTSNPLVWTYEWTVPSLGNTTGTTAIFTVVARDTFFNQTSNVTNSTRTIAPVSTNGGSTTVPRVASVTPNDAVISESDIGKKLTLTAVFSEAMDASVVPTFTLSPSVAVLTQDSLVWENTTTFVGTYTILDTHIEIGDLIDVVVTGGRDSEGDVHDSTTFTDVFKVDTLAPSASLSFNPDKVTYSDADTVRITAVVSEAVSDIHVALITPQGVIVDAPMTLESGTTYSYEFNVPQSSNHNGNLEVIVRATDLVGNSSSSAARDTSHKIFNEAGTTNPDPDPEPPAGGGGGGGTPVFAGGLVPSYYNPLAIYDFTTRRVDDDSILVTWRTNYPATTRVFYGENSVPKLAWEDYVGYQFGTIENTTLQTEHSVLLSGLTAGASYYVRGASHLKDNLNVFSNEHLVGNTASITIDDLVIEGAQCTYIEDYLGVHLKNDPAEVEKLQVFLLSYFGEGVQVDGTFSAQTRSLVEQFQIAEREYILDPWGIASPTGFVYITTKKRINEIVCDEVLSYTSRERAEIDAYRVREALNVADTPDVTPAPVRSEEDMIDVPVVPAEIIRLPEYENTDTLIVPTDTVEGGRRFILPGAIFFGIPDKLRIR